MAIGDRRVDPETGETAVVVWDGCRDGRGSDLLLSYHDCYTRQKKYAEEHRTRGATMHTHIRSNGPVYRGELEGSRG